MYLCDHVRVWIKYMLLFSEAGVGIDCHACVHLFFFFFFFLLLLLLLLLLSITFISLSCSCIYVNSVHFFFLKLVRGLVITLPCVHRLFILFIYYFFVENLCIYVKIKFIISFLKLV